MRKVLFLDMRCTMEVLLNVLLIQDVLMRIVSMKVIFKALAVLEGASVALIINQHIEFQSRLRIAVPTGK